MAVFSLANAVTAGRLVLFVIFLIFAWRRSITVAVALFGTAWALDVVDGWVARLFHHETAVGFLLDKVVDRVVIVGGAIFLLALGLVPDAAVFVLTKDIALLPVLTVHASAGERIASVGWMGKIITVLQGAALIWLLLDMPAPLAVVSPVAVVGGVVGTRHLYRVVYQ